MKHRKALADKVKKLNRYIHENNISDFMVQSMLGDVLSIVGSFDLCYYHDLEMKLTDVQKMVLCPEFYVNLCEDAPFSVAFSGETAILRFVDEVCGEQLEISFNGDLSVSEAHVPYF